MLSTASFSASSRLFKLHQISYIEGEKVTPHQPSLTREEKTNYPTHGDELQLTYYGSVVSRYRRAV